MTQIAIFRANCSDVEGYAMFGVLHVIACSDVIRVLAVLRRRFLLPTITAECLMAGLRGPTFSRSLEGDAKKTPP